MGDRLRDQSAMDRLRKKREAARRRKRHDDAKRKEKEAEKKKEAEGKRDQEPKEHNGAAGEEDDAPAEKLSPESEKLQNKIFTLLDSESRRTRKKVACVQFFVNRIFAIRDEGQEMEFDMYLKINWIEPKWRNKSDDEFQADEKRFEGLWKPGVEVTNKKEMTKLIPEKEAYWIEYPKHGILAYTQRLIGSTTLPMHLGEFPFDTQSIPITFESFHWKADDLHLVRLAEQSFQLPPRKGSNEQWLTMSDQVKLTEWRITGISVRETLKHYPFEDRTYSQIRVEIGIERNYGYYLTKVLLLLVILVMMSWVVFVFPTDDLSGRSGTTMTLFLAAIAFNFIISATLPKVSYMTKMDIYLLVCYAFVFLSVIQSGIVYALVQYLDLGDVAFEIDRWCLVAFPAIFFLYTIFFCLYIFKSLWHRTFRSTTMNTTLVVSGEKAKQHVTVTEDHVAAEGIIPQPANSSVTISVVDLLQQRVEVVVQR